jgi:hypothetical protein
MTEITHIKGSKVTPYKQRMYKIGYGPNTFGLTSEDRLSTITPPIQGAVEYSHTRTIHYLDEDPFSQSPTATTLEELELPFNE